MVNAMLLFDKQTYIERRKSLKQKVASGIILLMGNNDSPANYPNNVYRFRQDSSFLYFYGLHREGLAGIMPHPWLVALVPALGGVLCGLIKQYGGLPFDVPCATDGYVECVQHDGKVKPKTPFLLILAASITIGSGGSCGRECPTAYIGSGLGAIATRCLQFLRLDKLLGVKLGRRDFRLLAICGASAGLAAIFRALLFPALRRERASAGPQRPSPGSGDQGNKVTLCADNSGSYP